MLRVTIFAVAVATASQAHAGAVLWRTLEEGDSIEIAKAKIEAMPEVDRVKVVKKRGAEKLDINMKDGGVPIFDGHFSLEAAFDAGGLSMVRLTSGAGCLGDAYPFSLKINEELTKKYGAGAPLFVDQNEFTLRALGASAARSARLTSRYVNDQVGVIFSATFVQHSPPTYYGNTALSRSLYEIARNKYDAAAQHCGGAYYRTAQISLLYLSRSDLEEIGKNSETERQRERQQAGDNL